MIDPRLRARVERKLDLNERLVWAGKPVPWAFSKKTLGAMLFGIPWSFITATVMSGFIYSFFFTEDGRGEPLALKIGICIFFVPFVTIGVGMPAHPSGPVSARRTGSTRSPTSVPSSSASFTRATGVPPR